VIHAIEFTVPIGAEPLIRRGHRDRVFVYGIRRLLAVSGS
jgi:hypothetical protein